MKVFSTIAWILGTIIGFIIFAVVAIWLFVSFAPVFGGKPDTQSMDKIAQSSAFDGQRFLNRYPTEVMVDAQDKPSTWEFMKSMLMPPKGKNPSGPLPAIEQNYSELHEGAVVWFGHSTVLLRSNNLNIITDPVFYRASPAFFGGKPFPTHPDLSSQHLPELDVVVISHDHYDHLDEKSIREIHEKTRLFLVPLGVKAHLQRWGVDPSKVMELDWYEQYKVGETEFTFTPSRHFSGRGLFDRSKTLWGSWVIHTPLMKVYFSGDGGYSPDFKDIGEQYGPFDLALMEDGAYNKAWPQIHMFPEQSLQAGLDVRARYLMPIHWGKFDLSDHQWTEPAERISSAASGKDIQLVTPVIGEIFTLDAAPQQAWWKDVTREG